MTGLLTAVASVKPREKSGAHTMARYGFQVHTSILKMLDLHRAGADYRAVFDHFDDLMVFDKSDQPEKVSFFQIKSQNTGTWMLKEMTRRKGKGPPPVTFLGRLHHHMATFGQMVSCLGFVSNLAFKLKLADGTETTPDHHVIRATELHADEIAALKAAVAKDTATPPAVDGSQLFVFERTALGLMDQDSFVKGRLLEFVHARDDAQHVPVISLYETLRGSVLTKAGVTQAFTTTAEFYDRKTLPDYAPSSAKPLGLQNVRESVCWSLPKAICFIRRLYSSLSFNRQPLPRACTTCSKRGFTGAWQDTRG